jgi:hypothetical protein
MISSGLEEAIISIIKQPNVGGVASQIDTTTVPGFCWPRSQYLYLIASLLLSHTFKWFGVGLPVHELTVAAALRPRSGTRILRLRTVPHRAGP